MKTLEELNSQIGSMHDAVLLSIDLRWADGTVTLGIRTAAGPKRVIVQEVTRLVCPREDPWGRSECINEVRFGSPPSSAVFQMEIEMQSGDVLAICGTKIDVEP